MRDVRRAAVAGTWYPGSAGALAANVDACLEAAVAALPRSAASRFARIQALVAPHAGLQYSGPVAAYAYRQIADRAFDVAVLVGPSHFVDFEGVSVSRASGFETPFGVVPVDDRCASALVDATTVVHERPAAHAREHSLEMQLPFLHRVQPDLRIVPLVMGRQTAATAEALADALTRVLDGREALLVASTDLSHFYDARSAAALDRVVIDHVSRLDPEGLQRALDRRPDHACGGGPLVAVLRAARRLGARDVDVLRYADSGDVSGDKTEVVGYMAAAIGVREAP